MNILSFPLGRKARLRIAELERETARLRYNATEIRARERLITRMFSGVAQGSMSSELYNQSFPGANKYSGALSTYRAFSNSSNDQLRRLSRIAAFESPTGAAMIERLTAVVVGSGLRLQAEPMWEMIRQAMPLLALAEDVLLQRAWRKNVEQRYRLWAKSLQSSYNDEYNLYQIDHQCFKYLLKDGEYFLLLRYAATSRGNPLTIQVIPPENVRNGSAQPAAGNDLVNGIEYDARGAAVAYHIADEKTGLTKRIPRFGPKSGRIFVIHNYLKESENQRRGVPYLANVIHELTRLGDYEVLEIQAAIVNALFALWVSPPDDEDGQPTIGKGAARRAATPEEATGDPLSEYMAKTENIDFSHGGVIVDALPAGHKIESFDTKRPNQGFDNFFQAVKRNIAAAKGQPLAVVDLAFNNSYSGARGELLMFWMHVDQFKANHGWDFEDDIYQMWMWGEVDRGRIEAPGFAYDDFLRAAYANAQWIGNQRPDIDPQKSVNANILEQDRGYRTGHQITAERGGGDYEENLQVITGELELVAAANKPMSGIKQAQQQQPAPKPGQDDDDDQKNGGKDTD